jgi:hypothetical protein
MIRNAMSYCLFASKLVIAGMCANLAHANTVVTITSANSARADFALGGTPSNPLYTGTFYLTFEAPVALSVANLNISASIVSPTDPALTARLSGGSNVSIPNNFPVMISVSPPAAGGLEFINSAQVELYTTKLSMTDGQTYRLYKAPANGMFFDITRDVIAGSIRCRARTGGFSDFIMVVDNRSLTESAQDKYAFLAARLNDMAITATTRGLLQLDLDESLDEFLEGDYEDARAELDDLEQRIDVTAGINVPNRWIAGNTLDNIAGSVESEAATLDFYLRELIASEADDEGDDD